MAERTLQQPFFQSPAESQGLQGPGPQQPPDLGTALQWVLQRLFTLPQFRGLLPQMPVEQLPPSVIGAVRADASQGPTFGMTSPQQTTAGLGIAPQSLQFPQPQYGDAIMQGLRAIFGPQFLTSGPMTEHDYLGMVGPHAGLMGRGAGIPSMGVRGSRLDAGLADRLRMMLEGRAFSQEASQHTPSSFLPSGTGERVLGSHRPIEALLPEAGFLATLPPEAQSQLMGLPDDAFSSVMKTIRPPLDPAVEVSYDVLLNAFTQALKRAQLSR